MRLFGFLLGGVAFSVVFSAGRYAGAPDTASFWLIMLGAGIIYGVLVNAYAALTEG